MTDPFNEEKLTTLIRKTFQVESQNQEVCITNLKKKELRTDHARNQIIKKTR